MTNELLKARAEGAMQFETSKVWNPNSVRKSKGQPYTRQRMNGRARLVMTSQRGGHKLQYNEVSDVDLQETADTDTDPEVVIGMRARYSSVVKNNIP